MRVFSLPSPMDAGPSMTSTIGTASRPGTATNGTAFSWWGPDANMIIDGSFAYRGAVEIGQSIKLRMMFRSCRWRCTRKTA
jgi:hypothetical protein